MIELLYEAFQTPDDFSSDMLGLLGNQSGHMLLGLYVFATIKILHKTFLKKVIISHWSKKYDYAIIISVMMFYSLFEIFQVLYSDGLIEDSLYDTFFVFNGMYLGKSLSTRNMKGYYRSLILTFVGLLILYIRMNYNAVI